jgi:hypothetical protein
MTAAVSRTGRVDTDFLFLPRRLQTCLRGLPLRAEACRERPTYRSAVAACDLCRSAWAAYLLTRHSARPAYRKDLEAGLRACLHAVRVVAEHLDGPHRVLVLEYADNIAFRLYLVSVLHGQGTWAAIAEMIQRRRALTSRWGAQRGFAPAAG